MKGLSFYLFRKQNSIADIVSQSCHKQLLVVDTNVALQQIDALEFKCPAVASIIILQTVLQEIKHINLAVYRRINNLFRDETKTVIFFPNEVCSQTASFR